MDLDIVYNENCLEGLKKLPDNSVDCCVTSPPYYALRDYGTGKWIGGDPNCPHFRTSHLSKKCQTGHKNLMEMHGVSDSIYKSVCPLCGAKRVDEQIGLEETPEEYINKLVEVFTEVYRILKPEGTLWLNIGDSYWGGGWRNAAFNQKSGEIQKNSKGTHCGETMPALKGKQGDYKPKDLIGIPWMLAFALRASGWYLRQDIIWHKPNPMPESITDRCTKSHEYIFLFSKSQRYYFDYKAIQEKAVSSDDLERRIKNGKAEWKTDKAKDTYAVSGEGRDRRELYTQNEEGEYMRNKRDVWSVNIKPDTVAHFAVFPEDLIVPCILAGSKSGGIILDPFMGSGTTARVARKLNRHFVGFELNPDYCKIINKKTQVTGDLFY